MRGNIHVFIYGTLREPSIAGHLLRDGLRVAHAHVRGMLFDLNAFPALVLAGRDRVHGEIWRCPPEAIARLDDHEGIGDGHFRRVGVRVNGFACWTYVAGPALATRLEPGRRIHAGEWRGGELRTGQACGPG